MKLLRTDKYAPYTKAVEGLFNKACKLEAKWNREFERFAKNANEGKAEVPRVSFNRRLRELHSIRIRLRKLGFDVGD